MSYTENLIPALTSDTTPSGIANSSGVYGGYAAWRAFDHTNQPWITPSSIGTIDYQFPEPHVFTQYAVTSRIDENTPKSWIFEGSNDGVTWIPLDTQTGITDWYTLRVRKVFSIENTIAYTYGRLHITASCTGSYTGITELEMMETIVEIPPPPPWESPHYVEPGQQNLVSNPRFAETPDPMYTDLPTETEIGQLWGTWFMPFTAEITYKDTSDPPFPDGITAAMQIAWSTGMTWDAEQGKFCSQHFPIHTPRETILTLSFDVLGHGGNADIWLITTSPTGYTRVNINLDTAPTDEWTRFSASLAINPTTTAGWIGWDSIYSDSETAPDVTAFRVDYGNYNEYRDGDLDGWEWTDTPHQSASKAIDYPQMLDGLW